MYLGSYLPQIRSLVQSKMFQSGYTTMRSKQTDQYYYKERLTYFYLLYSKKNQFFNQRKIYIHANSRAKKAYESACIPTFFNDRKFMTTMKQSDWHAFHITTTTNRHTSKAEIAIYDANNEFRNIQSTIRMCIATNV